MDSAVNIDPILERQNKSYQKGKYDNVKVTLFGGRKLQKKHVTQQSMNDLYTLFA